MANANANAQPQVKLILVGGIAMMFFTSGLVAFMFLASAPVNEEGAAVPQPTVVATPLEPAPAPLALAPESGPSVAPVGTPRAKPSPGDRMARDLKREQIWRALGSSPPRQPAKAPEEATPPSEAAQPEAPELPPLDPEYIKSAIAEQLLPVAEECYESALEDEPELAGQLLVEFTIVGAEEVGGVVESAQINDESTLDNAFVRECMRESVMAVTFEPPEDGGQLAVTYPFNFEPE